MGTFIPVRDELSKSIDKEAQSLHRLLLELDAEHLGMPYYCLEYFKGSHFKRLFFSIQTSAQLLYRAITISGKKTSDIVIMDYGAGVGTLYTLAKMIGCKKVVYNDFLEDWKKSAELIAKAIRVEVDEYIVGDIQDTLNELDKKGIQCDIITSRNVIEHIYNLEIFYSLISKHQSNAIVYSSTTANARNPLTQIQHRMIHRKWERIFVEKRKDIAREFNPQWSEKHLTELADATRGMDINDIKISLTNYQKSKALPDPRRHGSNTCDPMTGVWFEHLISFNEYERLISKEKFKISFSPGLWDTHNKSWWKNMIGHLLNPIIRLNPRIGTFLAPFIYVIALPIHRAANKN